MKFALQLAAIILAVLVSRFVPAPDPEAFSAVDAPPWYVWIFLAFIAVQAWPTIRTRGQDAWRWVRDRSRTSGVEWRFAATFATGLVFGVAIGFTLARVDWTPGPTPPTPDPTPIVAPGFRVIIGRETGDKPTREQDLIYGSTAITAYLNEKCAKVAGRPAWRKWDDDDPKSEDAPEMVKLWDATKGEVPPPFIVMSNEKKTVVSPLPATEAATLELLKKYGG